MENNEWQDKTSDWMDDIVENVYRYYNHRKIVLWGAYEGSDTIREKLKEKYGLEVAFYVDGDSTKTDNKWVFSPDCLCGKAREYYVAIPLAFYRSLKEKLTENGYKENTDYYYFCDCIIQQRDDYYEDSHGNRIFGAYQGLKFAFSGFHSTIRIGKDVTIKNCTVYIHNHSNLTIGDDVYFTDSIIRMDDKTRIEIGRGCQIQDLAVDARLMSDILLHDEVSVNRGGYWDFNRGTKWIVDKEAKLEIGCRGIIFDGIFLLEKNSDLKIGDDFSVGWGYCFALQEYTSVTIGNDCMFSYDIDMRTNDGHSIFDIKTGKNINSTYEISKSRSIVIGNHVWVGMRSIVLYHTEIGDGSIIGANSLVKHRIPNNCIAVGSPAKVVKTDVAWGRESGAEDMTVCGPGNARMTR